MALDDVIAVLDRAIADVAFRELLLAEPAKALKGRRLTRGERSMLSGLADSPYTASARGLADVRKMAAGALLYGGESEPEHSSSTR